MSNLFFSELELKDKKFFDEYFSKVRQEISEMTFTNMFMWREAHNYMFTEIHGHPWIKVQKYDQVESIYIPMGISDEESFKLAFDALYQYFNKTGKKFFFTSVLDEQLKFFESIENCRIESDRDNWDYIYITSDLVFLSGKKYDGKRNRINKFLREHKYSIERITHQNIIYCYEILEKWIGQRSKQKNYAEYSAVRNLLDHYFSLDCKGILVVVDEKYAAFSIGEMLNNDTAVIHVEKAERGIEGLYQFINQKFCELEWQNAKYINREQDLGVQGLRRSKESYYPVKYVKKYKVFIT